MGRPHTRIRIDKGAVQHDLAEIQREQIGTIEAAAKIEVSVRSNIIE